MTYAPTLLAGRYVLDKRIGAGGYCEVWQATDTVLTRPVAVKLLHPGYAAQGEALARFKAEARHAGSLSHENVARVYDYGEPIDGQSYLVMELIDGPSLAEVLTRGPLGARRTMDLVAQVAAGLQAAHTAGLIHRDVKPANILFTSEGAVRITDFGIAHAVGSAPVTSTGMVMGTPGYIAPERVSGAQAGPASDLYALGVVAYECLTGAQPFGGGALEVAIAHRDRPLPPLPAWVPCEVTDLVMILTAKDPGWRPGSAGEVATQAAGLRDALTSDADRRWLSAMTGPSAPPVPVAPPPPAQLAPPVPMPGGLAVTSPDRSGSWTAFGAPVGSPVRRPRRRRAVTIAILALAALACLVLISLTGFAPGVHSSRTPAPTPSQGSSRSAPATTGSPAASPRTSPPTAQSASHSASQSSSAGTSTSTSTGTAQPSQATSGGHTNTPPGQQHHKKGHGKGNGKGNGNDNSQ